MGGRIPIGPGDVAIGLHAGRRPVRGGCPRHTMGPGAAEPAGPIDARDPPRMDDRELAQRLSQIQTMWSVVMRAHSGEADAAMSAQQVLMRRYSGAVYRYLAGFLRDYDAADDLAQEFALRVLRGDLRRADPARGRFRDYVKMVLRHLVADHHRRLMASPRPLPADGPEPAGGDGGFPDLDRQFLESWRKELLARAWAALERVAAESGRPYYAVLRLRADHPEMRSAAMAGELADRLGRPITAGAVRQTLSLAREKFADYLLDEVEHSLELPTPEQLREELIDLDLLPYCLPALERRGRRDPGPAPPRRPS